MVISSKPNTTSFQIRSTSFPCRSYHPIIRKLEDQLAELRQMSSLEHQHNIAQSVSGLASVYECVQELLRLPMTQQALSRYRDGKLVDELLDESVGVLDICDATRGLASQTKEHTRRLLCVIRRQRKGNDLSNDIENSVANYICFRKKIKKDATTRLIGNMKQVGDSSFIEDDQDDDHHLIAVIRIMTKITEMTTSIFESLIRFFSLAKPKKPSKWSIVTRKMMMHRGRVHHVAYCEDDHDDHQQVNAKNINNLDPALSLLLLDLCSCRNGSSGNEEVIKKKIHMAQSQLEAMEGYIESIENGLDCLFRHLIKARALLLNILSHHH